MENEERGEWDRRIVDSFEDSLIPGVWYLDLECGHKTMSREQNSGYIFCTSCWQPRREKAVT